MFNYSLKQQQGFKKQQGAALIVSLIILVAMTMVGITSMKSSSTEMTMAGNLRESAITFQAAEAGLSTAEDILIAGNNPPNMLEDIDVDPNYLNEATWSSGSANTIITDLANIATNPQYISKYLGEWDPDSQVSSLDPGFSGYGQASNAVKVGYFRITSRGSGQTGNTFRTVQSFFGRNQ